MKRISKRANNEFFPEEPLDAEEYEPASEYGYDEYGSGSPEDFAYEYDEEEYAAEGSAEYEDAGYDDYGNEPSYEEDYSDYPEDPYAEYFGKPKNRSSSRVVLSAVLAASFLFFAFAAVRFLAFPEKTRQQRVDAVEADTALIREEIDSLNAELDRQDRDMKRDLAEIGENGADIAAALEELRTKKESLSGQLEELNADLEDAENIQERIVELRDEYAGRIRELEDLILAGKSDVRICYWTLDDGPTGYTNAFLDYIESAGIYTTFFTCREANAIDKEDNERDILRREAAAGCSLANHAYIHEYALYGRLYQNVEDFMGFVNQQDDWVYENTGLRTEVFRFPGSEVYCGSIHGKDFLADAKEALNEAGYGWVEWSGDAYDSVGNVPNVANVLNQVKNRKISVLLTHDLNIATLGVMKSAVPQLQKMGYVFLPLFNDSWTMNRGTFDFDCDGNV